LSREGIRQAGRRNQRTKGTGKEGKKKKKKKSKKKISSRSETCVWLGAARVEAAKPRKRKEDCTYVCMYVGSVKERSKSLI
jgi:hypothetical protein